MVKSTITLLCALLLGGCSWLNPSSKRELSLPLIEGQPPATLKSNTEIESAEFEYEDIIEDGKVVGKTIKFEVGKSGTSEAAFASVMDAQAKLFQAFSALLQAAQKGAPGP